jgi:acyl carrier protein
MNETDVHDVVVTAIHRVAPDADLSQLSPTADFREALEIDSMDFLILADELHARTGVDIPERDYPQLTTVEGCVKFLAARGPTATPSL